MFIFYFFIIYLYFIIIIIIYSFIYLFISISVVYHGDHATEMNITKVTLFCYFFLSLRFMWAVYNLADAGRASNGPRIQHKEK